MTIAVLFPGQGSQKVGMGLDLFEQSEIGKEIFKKVDKIASREISDIFLYGPQEELNQTKNTQPAIVAVSVALMLILENELKNKNHEFKPVACCGHSLGEFTALWFAKVLSIDELIKLVLTRSELMEKMQNTKEGAMAAILNLSMDQIEKIISEDEYKNTMVIANHNGPSQFVVSGKKEAIVKISEKVKSLSAKAIILPVSGAFHSPLMEESSRLFSKEIDKLSLFSKDSVIPIYQNYDGSPAKDHKAIKEKIKKQMTSPVYWTQTITNLVNDGVNNVIEIGPGKVLTGLVKEINPNIGCYNIFDLESMRDFLNNNYEHELTLPKSKP